MRISDWSSDVCSSDLPVEAGFGRRPSHADDTAGRAGEDRVLALEGGRVGKATVRLHEEEARALSERPHDAVNVVAQHRREIGVDHAGIAASDQRTEEQTV